MGVSVRDVLNWFSWCERTQPTVGGSTPYEVALRVET